MTIQKQVNELTSLSSFADSNVIPVHDGNGLKKGTVTQLATNLASKFSNPNLLINPNFEVNQYGSTTYSDAGYTFDRWKLYNATITKTTNGITYSKAKSATYDGILDNFVGQSLENEISDVITISMKISSISGTFRIEVMKKGGDSLYRKDAVIGKKEFSTNGIQTFTLDCTSNPMQILRIGATTTSSSCNIEWVKLERNSIATSFVKPSFSDEYVRCMWFGQMITGARSGYYSGGKIYLNIPECAKMRISNPTVDAIDLTGWVYIGNSVVFTVAKSDITNVEVDGYKELVLTPSSSLATKLNGSGYKTIEYVIDKNKGLHLDAEIYIDE